MTREEFRADLAQYTVSELQLILATQADVYSPQEMEVIREELDARREQEHALRKKNDTNDTLPCVLSLLLPVIGLIIAAIFLSNHDPANQKTGKRCLVSAFVSLILFSYLLSGGISF
ncbi:MAG: hypothetical protein IK130_08905 [Oscillospiraceae bacterium]|nr:hypothetical protein [Oscillospiraceae bacterium]